MGLWELMTGADKTREESYLITVEGTSREYDADKHIERQFRDYESKLSIWERLF